MNLEILTKYSYILSIWGDKKWDKNELECHIEQGQFKIKPSALLARWVFLNSLSIIFKIPLRTRNDYY